MYLFYLITHGCTPNNWGEAAGAGVVPHEHLFIRENLGGRSVALCGDQRGEATHHRADAVTGKTPSMGRPSTTTTSHRDTIASMAGASMAGHPN